MITNNFIYDNADRGIQLYPDAQGSTIANNVIDGNGEGIIFSGDSGLASSNNVVRRNVISNSRVRYNVESWWPNGNPVGTGNLASDNCLWNGTQGNVADQVGFTASNNVVANPGYSDRSAGTSRSRPRAPAPDSARREHRRRRRSAVPAGHRGAREHGAAEGLRHNPRRLPADRVRRKLERDAPDPHLHLAAL